MAFLCCLRRWIKFIVFNSGVTLGVTFGVTSDKQIYTVSSPLTELINVKTAVNIRFRIPLILHVKTFCNINALICNQLHQTKPITDKKSLLFVCYRTKNFYLSSSFNG